MIMTEWGDMRPMYVQVATALRAKIDAGEIAPGQQIPPVTAIMAEFGVSNPTAQRAVRSLRAAGLVETRPGKGVFVRERRQLTSRSASYLVRADNEEKDRYRAKSKNIEVREVEPPDDVAEALGLDVGELAVLRGRTMIVDNEPVEIVISYFPVDLARDTDLTSLKQLRGGTMAELGRLGITLRDDCVEMVQTRMPSADEARILKIGPGTPVFRLLRTLYSAEGRPVEALDMVLPGDRYQLRYELPVHG